MFCQIRQLTLKHGRNKPLVFVHNWPSVGLCLYSLLGHGVQSVDMDTLRQVVGSSSEREAHQIAFRHQENISSCALALGIPVVLMQLQSLACKQTGL